MTHRPPGDDPKQIWQSQQAQGERLSAQEIERRIQKLQHFGRRKIAGVVIAIVVWIWLMPALIWAQDPYTKLGVGLFIVGVIGLLISQIRVLRMALSGGPTDPSMSVVEFYRRSLLALQSSYRRAALATMPILVGMFVFLLPGFQRILARGDFTPRARAIVPLIALLIVWAVSFFYLGGRGRRWLRREIESLDAIDRE